MQRPDFEEFWEQNKSLNPGVNVSVLTETARLNIHRLDGSIQTIMVHSLLARRNLLRTKTDILASEDPEFAHLFMTDLNENIDFTHLLRGDNVVRLFFKDTKGKIKETTARKYFYSRNTVKRNYVKRKDPDGYDRRRKIIHKAYDSQKFQMFWKKYKDLNPGVDPTRLTAQDYVNYKNRMTGKVERILVRAVLQRKNSVMPISERSAWDDPEFRETFPADLNPGIDMMQVRRSDTKTLLNGIGRRGLAIQQTPSNFFRAQVRRMEHREKLKSDTSGRHWNMQLAWDDPGFRDFFDPTLNPDINILTLYRTSKVIIRYYETSGEIGESMIGPLFRSGHFRRPYACRKYVYAMEFPDFVDAVTPELNPGIDLSKLKRNDNKTRVRVYLDSGIIGTIIVKGYFAHRAHAKHDPEEWEHFIHARKYYEQNKDKHVSGDPNFWQYCLEPDKNFYNNAVKTSKAKVRMRCNKNHPVFRVSIGNFYSHNEKINEICPYCTGKKVEQGVNDAVTLDPEIALYWDPKNGSCDCVIVNSKRYSFVCPFCGHRFTREINVIVGQHPKCMICKDTGIVESHGRYNMAPPDIPFGAMMKDTAGEEA